MNEKGARPSPALNNAVQTTSIPFSLMPGQSRLFLDYQNDPASLKRFYPNAVRNVAEVQAFVPEVLSRYETDRDALCSALLAVNSKFGASSETLDNVRRLGQRDCVAVVTGQQAGLFTGPLYTIYKAMSAIKAAECLTAHGINAVPVFWIATEDHDFDEVSRAFAFDSSGNVTETIVGLGENLAGTPVGNVRLDSGIRNMINDLLGELAVTEFTPELKRILSECWEEGSLFGTAFGKTFARIFSRYGLVLLDPMDPEMKRLASPLYVRTIENSDAIVGGLSARGREIEAAGYHNQVLVKDDYFPLFWHTDKGIRSSLRKIRDKVYRSKEDRREFTVLELAELAKTGPERFSPGVMLRGAVQDYLLPSICYFGGSAEIAYSAQNSAVYRILERPVTPVIHRQSFTIVESRHARTMHEFGLEFADFFKGIDALIPRIVESHISPDTGRLFTDVEEKINLELNRLDHALSWLDNTLAESLAKRRRKILCHVAELRKRAYRSEMQRNEVIDRRIRSAVTTLLPSGQLQERVINFAGFYNKYGPYFIEWIYGSTEIDERGHKLIYL